MNDSPLAKVCLYFWIGFHDLAFLGEGHERAGEGVTRREHLRVTVHRRDHVVAGDDEGTVMRLAPHRTLLAHRLVVRKRIGQDRSVCVKKSTICRSVTRISLFGCLPDEHREAIDRLVAPALGRPAIPVVTRLRPLPDRCAERS